MQFSLRSLLLIMFVIAIAAALGRSAGMLVEVAWVLLPAVLVTYCRHGNGDQRTGAMGALATYAAWHTLCISHGIGPLGWRPLMGIGITLFSAWLSPWLRRHWLLVPHTSLQSGRESDRE